MAMSFVQGTRITPYSGTGRSSDTLAFASNVTVGDLLIVVSACQNATPSSIADTQGNSWASLKTGNSSATNCTLFWTVATATGANTVTVTYSSSAAVYTTLEIGEFSGVPVPASSTANNSGTGTAGSAGPITLTATGLVIAFGANASGSVTPGSGFTLMTTAGNSAYSMYQLNVAAGSISATATVNSPWGMGLVAFYPPVSGGNRSWLSVGLNNGLRGVRH